MSAYEVTSEIYSECDYKTKHPPIKSGNIVSEFSFIHSSDDDVNTDEDGDLVINRKNEVIQIEHSVSTSLPLVGLQVWRGALLLADLALYWGHKGYLNNTTLLELGAGTGLSSFVAAMFAKKVLCTDIDAGGILDLIEINAKRNKNLIKSEFSVQNLDFTKEFSKQMTEELSSVDIVFAADVIYDDSLTEHFINVIERILNIPPSKIILIALEKRYVFTLSELDSVAPCYETFLNLLDRMKCRNIAKNWQVEQLTTDFPHYFKYDRVKELVLWQIKNNSK